jgi:S-adenosylmethionine decarboxylase
MAFHDALFQLGMDLDQGSSTAQTEEKHLTVVSTSNPEDRKDYFCERNGVKFAGTHLIVDVLNGTRLDDIGHIENTFRRCIEVSGATLLHIHMHHFTPNGGVSGVAVLSESHISIHSWPEYGYAALDIFMCGHARPHLAIDVIREAFGAGEVIVKELLRGEEVARQVFKAAA